MTVDDWFFPAVVELAKKYEFYVMHDFAYGETCFNDYKAPSYLSAPGAKEVGVEFSTLSKAYNMAGWRIGFCAGNAQMISALATVKGYYDYGIFQPIQIASIIAMRECEEYIGKQAKVYQKRRNVVLQGLQKIGWSCETPRAGMFVWARISDKHLQGLSTIDYALRLMEEAEVAIAPGRAFGEGGEGYVRIALVENDQRLRQAMRQIDRFVHRKPKKRSRPSRKTL
jgi:alanine-synthesizing transaminase